MRGLLVPAFAFALSLALGPNALAKDPPITNPSTLIARVTPENVSEIIREIGGQEVKVHEEEGQKSISFVDAGTTYNIGFALCLKEKPDDCAALTMLVLVEKPGYSYEILNKHNKDTLFLTLFKDDESNLGIARVELVEGGTTKKNLALAIIWFVTEYRETIEKLQATAAYQAPGTLRTPAAALRSVVAAPGLVARWSEELTKSHPRSKLAR